MWKSLLFLTNVISVSTLFVLLNTRYKNIQFTQMTLDFYSIKADSKKSKRPLCLDIIYTKQERLWLSKYALMVVNLIISVVFFAIVTLGFQMRSVFLLFLVIGGVPIGHIFWRTQQLSAEIENQILGFMQNFHAGFLQSGEILQTIQYCLQNTEAPYLKRLLERFQFSILKGMSPNVAFEQMRLDANHDYFSYVLLNIEQIYHRRGNVLDLIQSLQNEYTAIKVELNKRHVELKHERNFVFVCASTFIGVWYYMFYSKSYLWDFYLKNDLYAYVVATIIVTLAVTLFLILKSNHLKY